VLKTADLELYGAGRTDAGVHAIAQVAHLQVTTMLAPHIIRMKMNDELPADINIIEAERIHPNFHARHDAIARSYLYQISRRRTALGKRFVWWIKDDLDVKRMNAAASKFLGLKNFQSFTADEPEEKSTKALIEEFQLKDDSALILIRIVGSHFLWKQVRQIVGVLAELGRGRLSEADIERFLNEPSDEPAKFTAPPSGLFLERVYYKGDVRNLPLLPVMAI
jgi:tRNA pseudouridine38-40 synthase